MGVVFVVLAGLAGYALGRANSGIKYVGGREFITCAESQTAIRSAFSATMSGAPLERAYLEYWSGTASFDPGAAVGHPERTAF